LYAQSSFSNELYTIDLATGSASLVGSNDTDFVKGIAFDTPKIPEPATLALLCLVVAGIAWRRRTAHG
jgi:hypothetical protein